MTAEQKEKMARVGMWLFAASSFAFLMIACAPLTGIMGHMIMAIFDSAFCAHLTPVAPYVAWGAAGALIGAGPALWSISGLRKRRMLVLWAPLAVVLIVGVYSTLLSQFH